MIAFGNIELHGFGGDLAVTRDLSLLKLQFIESSQSLSKGVPSEGGAGEAKIFCPRIDPRYEIVLHGHLNGFHSYGAT